MPILAMSAGRVTAIWGNAYVSLPDGSLKPLQVGDRVPGGARIVTEADGIVEISPTRGPAVLVKQAAVPMVVDKAIHALESQEPDQAPGSGLGGGGSGSLTAGLRVDRVSESGASQAAHLFDAAAERNGTPAPIREAGAAVLPPAQALDDAGPRVISVDVVASDPGHVYFSVRLDKVSESAVQLKLQLSPGEHDVALGDIWTGGIEYAVLDRLPQGDMDLAFEPFNQAAAPIEPAVPGDSVMVLPLPPLAPAGVILFKVPLFVGADPEGPHLESVKLLASTPDNSEPQWGEATLLHGEIDIAPVQPVMEGESAVFDLSLSRPLGRALPVKLSLLGDDDTDDNSKAGATVTGHARDVDPQLYVALGEDGPWQALGGDGVVVIPAELQHLRVKVNTVDDADLEADESFRLSLSGVEGSVILTSAMTAHALILDDDSRFDPVSGTWLSPLSPSAAEALALDPRDLLTMADDAAAQGGDEALQTLATHPSEVNAAEIYIAKSDGFAYSAGLFDAISQASAAALREVPNRLD